MFKLKRSISLVLALIFALSVFGMTALAAEETELVGQEIVPTSTTWVINANNTSVFETANAANALGVIHRGAIGVLASSGTVNGRINLRISSVGGWPVHNGWYTWSLWIPVSAITLFTPASGELEALTSQIVENETEELRVGTFARTFVNSNVWNVATGGQTMGLLPHGTVVEIVQWGVSRTFVSVTPRNDHGQPIPPLLVNRTWWISTAALEVIQPWHDSIGEYVITELVAFNEQELYDNIITPCQLNEEVYGA